MLSRCMNFCPVYVVTCLLYGGLNHVMLLFLLFFLFVFVSE